jgi:glycosyltransferase involved in cell wall biosynthesis
MKILYFHQHFSTPEGSTGIRSYVMAKNVIQRGHEVTMVCGSYDGGQTGLKDEFKKGKRAGVVDGINIIEFDLNYSNSDGLVKRSLTFLMFALKSIGLALTKDYDVVFATTTPLTAGIPGIFARWLRGKHFVFEVRDLWPELPKQMGVIKNPVILGLMSALEWLSYRSAHRCIGLSPGIVDGIAARGVSKDKIKLIPNGCDLNVFANNEASPWRPEGVNNTDFMAVFTGTHGIANGLDAVLDVAKELKSRCDKRIKIVLIGQGKLKPQLQARAEKEKLTNVIFLDPVNKGELSGLMESADIGLQILANIPAFYYGTSPNKFFDYIASGLPVLNNYPGWLAGMIKDNYCGFSVPPENAIAFADALENASNNKAQLVEMGENASKLAVSSFDRKHLAEEWADFVTGILK